MHAGLGKNDSGRVQISELEKTSSLKRQIVCKKLTKFLYQTFVLVEAWFDCRPDEGPSPL